MIHPIFTTALRRPDLIASHLANYGALLKAELSSLGSSLVARAVAAVIALVALMLALGLTGVAVMLGVLHGSHHWALLAVPGAAWLLTVGCGLYAMRSTASDKVDDIKGELEADVQMFRLIKDIKDMKNG